MSKEIIAITVIDRAGTEQAIDLPTDMNLNLMEGCRINELPVEGTCGGMALCASCHVYVHTEDIIPLERGDDEQAMLDDTENVKPNSRLCCQIRITENLEGAIVELAPETNGGEEDEDW